MKLSVFLMAVDRGRVLDLTKPAVVITSTDSSPTLVSPIPVTFTFTEDVTGFVVEDITVGGGTAGGFATVDGSLYTANITPSGPGTVTVDVAADVCADVAGNLNTAAVQFSIEYIGV